jgi:hypothetical protein
MNAKIAGRGYLKTLRKLLPEMANPHTDLPLATCEMDPTAASLGEHNIFGLIRHAQEPHILLRQAKSSERLSGDSLRYPPK